MDVISIPLLIITIHPIGGRGNQTRDDQTTIKNDGTAGETGIRMPAVISLDQVSMIMVIRRGRIGLVGKGFVRDDMLCRIGHKHVYLAHLVMSSKVGERMGGIDFMTFSST
jgi:hypothetical protein